MLFPEMKVSKYIFQQSIQVEMPCNERLFRKTYLNVKIQAQTRSRIVHRLWLLRIETGIYVCVCSASFSSKFNEA